MKRTIPRGAASRGGFSLRAGWRPKSHELTKEVGEQLILQWSAKGSGGEAGWAQLEVLEEVSLGVEEFRGGTGWLPIASGQTLFLDASGPVSSQWFQGATPIPTLGILRILGTPSDQSDLPDLAGAFVVDSHKFLLTVIPSSIFNLQSVGEPTIQSRR